MFRDPYAVLGVSPSADEKQIRQRYLQLVREHPPERDPEAFAEIRAAYDRVRNPVVSLEHRLFDLTTIETIDDILEEQSRQRSRRRIPTDVLLSLGDK